MQKINPTPFIASSRNEIHSYQTTGHLHTEVKTTPNVANGIVLKKIALSFCGLQEEELGDYSFDVAEESLDLWKIDRYVEATIGA